MSLEWHSATSSHRRLLRVFVCAQPDHSVYNEDTEEEGHEYPWEYEVQRHIRSLNPPLYAPSFLILGFDESGLAAVLVVEVQPFDAYCFVAAVAVAHRVSRQGYAGVALDRVHSVMRAYGDRRYTVQALVDPENFAAKSVFRRRGYKHVSGRGRYELWAQTFEHDDSTGATADADRAIVAVHADE